jgi:hypothetical protein
MDTPLIIDYLVMMLLVLAGVVGFAIAGVVGLRRRRRQNPTNRAQRTSKD